MRQCYTTVAAARTELEQQVLSVDFFRLSFVPQAAVFAVVYMIYVDVRSELGRRCGGVSRCVAEHQGFPFALHSTTDFLSGSADVCADAQFANSAVCLRWRRGARRYRPASSCSVVSGSNRACLCLGRLAARDSISTQRRADTCLAPIGSTLRCSTANGAR